MVSKRSDACAPEDRRRKPRNKVRLVFPLTGLSLPASTVRALIDDGLARIIALRLANQKGTIFSSKGRQNSPAAPLSTLASSRAVAAKMQSGGSPKQTSQPD